MNYLIKTNQPITEPISLDEARLHLRLDVFGSPPSHPDDTLVQTLITAAREAAEQHTGVTLARTDYEMQGTIKNKELSLKTYPVTEIASVTYEDDAGATQTVDPSEYSLNNFERPTRLVFTGNLPDKTMTVRFTAGYTDGQSPNPFPCPASIKSAMLLLIGHLYENRESVSVGNIVNEYPLGYVYLLTPYRVNMGL